MRAALKEDALIAQIEGKAASVLRRIRSHRGGTKNTQPTTDRKSNNYAFDKLWIMRQIRQTRHSCKSAKELIGYSPVVTGYESLEQFCNWYEEKFGFQGPAGPLGRILARVVSGGRLASS